ncbi:MAG: hypothetical protein ACLPN1_11040 [Dissulfurispiraceae bacterium]|jgi:hypothetical protein
MGYSQVALENKLLDMYPEITRKGFKPMMSFDQEKDSWVVRLKDGKCDFTVYLNKKDADACMDGTFCEDFATEIKKHLDKCVCH